MQVDAFSEEHEQHQTMLRRRRASVVTHAQRAERGDQVFLNFENHDTVALTTQARVNCATREPPVLAQHFDSGAY